MHEFYETKVFLVDFVDSLNFQIIHFRPFTYRYSMFVDVTFTCMRHVWQSWVNQNNPCHILYNEKCNNGLTSHFICCVMLHVVPVLNLGNKYINLSSKLFGY